MNPLETLKNALADLEAPVDMSEPGLPQLRARGETILLAQGQVVDGAIAEKRGLLASEQRLIDKARTAVAALTERVNELAEQERRLGVADNARRVAGGGNTNAGATYTRSTTYRPTSDSPSFFLDCLHARKGDADAADRLRRNNAEVGLESRALGNTGATGGSGGEFAPPAWFVSDFVKIARPGRVFADRLHHEPLPSGISSVNLPRLVTGTTTAAQTTQNSAISQTDATTAYVTSGVVTIAGKQIVSQQMIDQSGVPFDRVVLGDLAADYARALDVQALGGSGTGSQLRGYLTATSTNTVTWTTGAPTATGFYGQLAQLQGNINATRFVSPNTVVMHPRRWAWLASYTDTTGRPLVLPTSGSFNAMASPGDAVAQGHAGTILGMDVFVDPNIPTNLGAGTNQDVILMFPSDDLWLWEGDLRAEAFTDTYADSLGVLLRVYNYSAFIPDRYQASLGKITGTGLVPPVFAS